MIKSQTLDFHLISFSKIEFQNKTLLHLIDVFSKFSSSYSPQHEHYWPPSESESEPWAECSKAVDDVKGTSPDTWRLWISRHADLAASWTDGMPSYSRVQRPPRPIDKALDSRAHAPAHFYCNRASECRHSGCGVAGCRRLICWRMWSPAPSDGCWLCSGWRCVPSSGVPRWCFHLGFHRPV